MNWKRLALIAVLVDLVALTAYAVYHHGLLSFFALHSMNAVQLQIFFDLVIALSLFLVWMVRDAREQGISAAPYVVLTLTLGSIGALLYLIRRTGDERAPLGVGALNELAGGASRPV